jgi:RNA polymerase sigma factor (sigma-70 family)
MSSADAFLDLLCRARAGDQQAADELFRRYEPALRRFIRTQMWHRHLRRTLDSIDVCQSVFAGFFHGLRLGQYDLKSPEDLCKLLMVMARNKVISQMRRAHVTRQQERQSPDGGGDAAGPLVSPEAPPGWQTEARDLLEAVRRRLTDEERWLAEQYALGRPWAEIAAERQASPEALRKKHERALRRVARELGLQD